MTTCLAIAICGLVVATVALICAAIGFYELYK